MNMLNRDTALVTMGQVAAKRALREKKIAQRDELNNDIDALDKWLEAVSILAGTDVVAQTVPDMEGGETDAGDGENMAHAAKRILANFPKGIGHAQLQDELKKIPVFADRLSKNPGYYYTLISRLKKRGQVVKYRKALRLPQPKAENETAPEGAA